MKLRLLTWFGLLLLLCGIFLPWAGRDVPHGRMIELGIERADGKLMIGVALAATLADVMAGLWKQRRWLLSGGTVAIVGAMLLSVNLVEILQLNRKRPPSPSAARSAGTGARSHAGVGIYVALGGSLLATAGFVLRWKVSGTYEKSAK